MVNRILILILIICSSGCATMFCDSKDVITVRSNNPEAKIIINGNEVGKGYATYSLQRGRDAIITASLKGCSDRLIPTEHKITGVAWLNIIFWPGFLIDIATGKINRADPVYYVVTPACDDKQ